MDQRYISDELTHFVGRAAPSDDDRFALLVEILRTGTLKAPPLSRSASKKLKAQRVIGGTSFSGRDMYRSSVVCFCDIPVGDLKLHMSKYSHFGLSFSKHSLLQRGANPVFYIATDSVVKEPLPSFDDAEWSLKEADPYPRQQYLDSLIDVLHARRMELFSRLGRSCLVTENHPDRLSDIDFTLLVQLEVLLDTIDDQLLSFCVPFSAETPDEDPNNFYFEREWLALGDVAFELNDVCRILLPKQWNMHLRERVPQYCGQVMFTDS